MKVVLAEKPSVARDLAAFLGATTRHDGWLEGAGYQVTWALGHLVELKEPQDYNPELRRWSLASLPYVPPRFELKLIDEIVQEPLGGAHRDAAAMAQNLKERLLANVERLSRTPLTQLLAARHQRLMSYGAYQS